MIETHAEMTSYLTLLLCTLGIMVGLFTVTGFINRMGGMLLELGEWHIIAMILMAWVFGWLVGAGLPPTATYIILAVIVVDPMRKLGVDPWVAHFFCFLIAVWGELSPPTSLTAAVSARIAEASFIKTMYDALKLCLPVTLMTFAIFVRSELVTNPGWKGIIGHADHIDRMLGCFLCHVWPDIQCEDDGPAGANGVGPFLAGGDALPGRHGGAGGGGDRGAGDLLRHVSPQNHLPPEEHAATGARQLI